MGGLLDPDLRWHRVGGPACAWTIGAAALVSWTLAPGAEADINPWTASKLYNPEK